MPTPPPSNAEIERRKRALFQARQEAPQRQFARASELLGIHRSTLKRWLDKERTRPQAAAPPVLSGEKPRIRVQALSRPHVEEGPIIRVMALGDPHDCPSRPKERFRWLGRWAEAHANKLHHVVVIGDTVCLDSLSTHDKPGSKGDIERPSFSQELDSLDEALSEFHRDFPVGTLPITHTNGNHENRAVRAATTAPKSCGDLPLRLDEVFARYRWQTYDFGEFVNIAGVDFVHCPLNVRRQEVSAESALRNKSPRSLVMGHTHVNGQFPSVQFGQGSNGTGERKDILNLGTAMPWGERAHYVGTAQTGWWYGMYDIRILGGMILSAKPISMLELEEDYGD